jgi:hypothetical protein
VRIASLIVGILIVLGVISSVLRTLVVPRAVQSKLAKSVLFGTIWPFRFLARRSDDYERRDSLLASAAPLSILTTLIVWLILFQLGYSLMIFGTSSLSFGNSVRQAGSSLFTLGFASDNSIDLTAIDFMAAATGPIVIGLLIGYLPVLYGEYNRRETEVTMLDSRAGEPSWGPEILARHAAVNSVVNLDDLFLGWERWAAEVSESHTNYPTLVWTRSQRAHRHWLIALVAVMDAAAMQLAMNPSHSQGRARLALRQGFITLRDLARVEGIEFNVDPNPDDDIALPKEQFIWAVEYVAGQGFPQERSAEEAWPHFKGWRINYESIAYQLAEMLDAPPAKWTGKRYGGLGEMEPNRPVNRQPGGGSGRPWQGSADETLPNEPEA